MKKKLQNKEKQWWKYISKRAPLSSYKRNFLKILKQEVPNYSEYLKSNNWKLKSELIKQAYGYTCQQCLLVTPPEELQCHHKTYFRLGFEDFDDLIPVCSGCHFRLHHNPP